MGETESATVGEEGGLGEGDHGQTAAGAEQPDQRDQSVDATVGVVGDIPGCPGEELPACAATMTLY